MPGTQPQRAADLADHQSLALVRAYIGDLADLEIIRRIDWPTDHSIRWARCRGLPMQTRCNSWAD
jgi:hypothetical protein